MSLKYTSLTALNTYLGTSGVDSLITQIGEGAEALFDTLIGNSLATGSYTETFRLGYAAIPCDEGRIFYLSANNITQINTINGVSAGTKDVDYTIDLQRLELKTGVLAPTTFPYKYTIAYTAGYSTIPEDVKLAVNTLVWALYNTRNSNGIASYRQDLLSVNFKDASILDTITDKEAKGFVQAIVNKYKIHTVLS